MKTETKNIKTFSTFSLKVELLRREDSEERKMHLEFTTPAILRELEIRKMKAERESNDKKLQKIFINALKDSEQLPDDIGIEQYSDDQIRKEVVKRAQARAGKKSDGQILIDCDRDRSFAIIEGSGREIIAALSTMLQRNDIAFNLVKNAVQVTEIYLKDKN